MPETVIYLRGFPPPGSMPDADSGMMAGLKAVSTLKDEEIITLRERLTQVKGFLDPKALAAAVRQVVTKEETARSVHKTLQNLEPKSIKRFLEGLAERRKQEKDFLLTELELGRLGEILPTLVQPYPALDRYRKAERLAKLTGQELESIDLICDLRPIFDEDRQQIEGMMPYTRLHIVATGADGLPKSFEAELTHQQVSDLQAKAAKAESKLTVLRKSVEGWLPGRIPELPLTRVTRKESSDA